MKRLLATSAAALVALLGVATQSGSAAQAAPSPGSPGVPQPGTPLFTEDFQPTGDAAVDITTYVGAGGMRYTADPAWTPASQACNGWVMKSGTALPADPGCTSVWGRSEALAIALGTAQGMANPTDNWALTAYTNRGSSNTGYTGTLLKTVSGIPATGGHYYAVSAYFGEASCELQQAGNSSLTFSLIENGVDKELQSGLKPCVVGVVDRGPDGFVPTAAQLSNLGSLTAQQRTNMQNDVWIAILVSDALQLPTGSQTDLGFRVDNATDTGTGNDLVFDLPQIVDVTPQLDMAFSPARIDQGGFSTLTYTITNTDELDASTGLPADKTGWNFTNQLPAGVQAVGAPTSSTCTGFTGAVVDGSVVVTGSLVGQTSCTVELTVTAPTGGRYTDGPDDFAPTTPQSPPPPPGQATPACATGPGVGLCGLLAPAATTLAVYPILVDDTATTPFGEPVTVNVMDNDELVPSPASVTDVQPDNPSDGTWTWTADGKVTFTPAPDFDGVATATYTVTFRDVLTGSWTTSTATVTVTVEVPPPPITSASPTTGIAGTGVPGDDVTVTLPNGDQVTVPVGPDGTWSVPPALLTAEQLASLTPTSTVTAVQTDPQSGNTSSLTTMPLPPSVTTDGTGASGQGIPGATVTVTTNGGNPLCTATVAADETWSCTFATPLDPATPVLARQSLDPTSPSLTSTATTPVDEDDPVDPSGPTTGSADPTQPSATSADPPGSLASTGASPGLTAAVGAVTVLAGTALLLARAQRRRYVG